MSIQDLVVNPTNGSWTAEIITNNFQIVKDVIESMQSTLDQLKQFYAAQPQPVGAEVSTVQAAPVAAPVVNQVEAAPVAPPVVNPVEAAPIVSAPPADTQPQPVSVNTNSTVTLQRYENELPNVAGFAEGQEIIYRGTLLKRQGDSWMDTSKDPYQPYCI